MVPFIVCHVLQGNHLQDQYPFIKLHTPGLPSQWLAERARNTSKVRCTKPWVTMANLNEREKGGDGGENSWDKKSNLLVWKKCDHLLSAPISLEAAEDPVSRWALLDGAAWPCLALSGPAWLSLTVWLMSNPAWLSRRVWHCHLVFFARTAPWSRSCQQYFACSGIRVTSLFSHFLSY